MKAPALPSTVPRTGKVFDAIVVGGGLVGTAIALGLQSRGLDTVLLDEGDVAFRAARGNFGLVWVQSKGHTYRPYARLSRRAAGEWPAFARDLADRTGIDVGLESAGGFYLCLSEAEFAARARLMERQFEADLPVPDAYEMMDRRTLRDHLPDIGEAVVGACFCRLDGAANPLALFHALHAAYHRAGGTLRSGMPARRITPAAEGGSVDTDGGRYSAPRIVLAAGLANADLGADIGLQMPVRPVRGQILVTQKLPARLRYPTHTIRQMPEGGIILGDSREDVGLDDGTRPEVMSAIAGRAIASFPFLEHVHLLRAWGGLRTMTPDGVPLYRQSRAHSGLFGINVHSGVTLAPIHAGALAAAIVDGHVAEAFPEFAELRS